MRSECSLPVAVQLLIAGGGTPFVPIHGFLQTGILQNGIQGNEFLEIKIRIALLIQVSNDSGNLRRDGIIIDNFLSDHICKRAGGKIEFGAAFTQHHLAFLTGSGLFITCDPAIGKQIKIMFVGKNDMFLLFEQDSFRRRFIWYRNFFRIIIPEAHEIVDAAEILIHGSASGAGMPRGMAGFTLERIVTHHAE